MTQTANNYGEVLFELGIKKDTVEESKRIFSLTEQLHRTLESPIISKNEKYSIIEKVFPKEIENFLKVVCDHEKMSYIDEIIEAYYKKYNEANNILTATLFYVVEPNENQLSLPLMLLSSSISPTFKTKPPISSGCSTIVSSTVSLLYFFAR